MNERGVVVACRVKMYRKTKAYEEISIKVLIEDELKGEWWRCVKHTYEAKMAAINTLSTNLIPKMHLRLYLPDTAS